MVAVPPPDRTGREKILQIYLKGKKVVKNKIKNNN
jgi:ATP-dependent Zn protease